MRDIINITVNNLALLLMQPLHATHIAVSHLILFAYNNFDAVSVAYFVFTPIRFMAHEAYDECQLFISFADARSTNTFNLCFILSVYLRN